MACGTAVLTTREGTEDYAVDGVNALVVPGRDVQRLAEGLVTLLDRPELRRTLAEGGRATARRFTWDAGYDMFAAAISESLDAVRHP
jgi:glycosyltransferase involved in cell wall biosynthesis